MIRLSSVTKSFRDTPAVDALNFEFQDNEIFGIVGPDGAGKSTLLRIMAAILPPDSGTIFYNTTDIYKDPFFMKERMAYMPQRFGLYEDLTVEENILFFGRLFGVRLREIRKRLKRLYGFSRLGPFKDRLAGKLSGGMKQKLGLACCLVHSPEIILLDEPTNGVDPVSRREFWEILYDLLREGVSIIISTAYLDEAERCNRIAFMHRGSFIREGSPKSIREGTGQSLIEIEAGDSRKAEIALKASSRYSGVLRTGTRIRLFTGDVPRARREIYALLKKSGTRPGKIRITRPTLEESFIEIVSQEEGK